MVNALLSLSLHEGNSNMRLHIASDIELSVNAKKTTTPVQCWFVKLGYIWATCACSFASLLYWGSKIFKNARTETMLFGGLRWAFLIFLCCQVSAQFNFSWLEPYVCVTILCLVVSFSLFLAGKKNSLCNLSFPNQHTFVWELLRALLSCSAIISKQFL